jgi:hypothetical protein
MMNVIQLQDKLKNFSQDQLIREMQMPSGNTPQYLVLGEIMRRKQMESAVAGQQAPQATVAEEAVAAAGVPQGGISDMARALAPQTDMAQNTGVQAMARGGPVKKMAEGDEVDRRPPAYLTDETLRIMANRQGMSVDKYLTSVGPERAAAIIADVQRRAAGQTAFIPNAFNENLPVRGTQTGLDEFYPSFGQVKLEALAELSANPTRSFGGADQYDRGMPELLTAQQTYDQENLLSYPVPNQRGPAGGFVSAPAAEPAYVMPTPLTADEQAMFAFGVPASGRELPGMNTREEALAIALAKPPGTGGARDALIASGTPGVNIAALLPRPEDLIAPARPASSGPQGSKAQYLLGQPEYQVAAENRMPASSGPQGSKAQYLLGQPEYQVAAENMIPEGQSAGAAPFVRLPPAPDRSGLSGNAERNLGENSLARIPDLLNTEIKIGPDGTITTVPPKKSEATQEGGVPAESVEQMLKRRLAAQEADKTTANDAAKPVADTPAPAPANVVAAPAQSAPQGGGIGGIGGGGRGGALSPYEQQLMDAIAAREKAAKQDKWLALAQIGLSMMSSTQPTLLGAVGEAGLKGIEALRAARDKYDEDKLSLQAALEKARMARGAAVSRAASSATGLGGLKMKDYLGQLKNASEVARGSLGLLTGGIDPNIAMSAAEAQGNLDLKLKIQTALKAALQADQRYTTAVQGLGGATPAPVVEDELSFSVIE